MIIKLNQNEIAQALSEYAESKRNRDRQDNAITEEISFEIIPYGDELNDDGTVIYDSITAFVPFD